MLCKLARQKIPLRAIPARWTTKKSIDTSFTPLIPQSTEQLELAHLIEPGCCLKHWPQSAAKLAGEKPKRKAPVLDPSLYPVDPSRRMKSLMKLNPEPGLVLENCNVPAVASHEVLVRVNKSAICGTDLHIYNWDQWAQQTVPTPMSIGHEFMGTIVEVGGHVKGLAVGDRVTGEGHITCEHCRNCRAGKRHLCRNTIGLGVNRPGCFAEYVNLPATNIFKLAPQIPDDIAAFMDPLGNAVHSALSYDLVGEDVLITGAGPIGMMSAAICRQVGARFVVVTDVNDYRLNIAKHCGADRVVNVSGGGAVDSLRTTMESLGMKEGFDVGLEMSGSPFALNDMLATVKHGGKISMLGIPKEPFAIDWNLVIFKGLIIKGIYGREMFETWYKMSNMLVAGLTERIRPVLTHDVAADDYRRAFASCAQASSGKVILDWK